MHRGKGFVAAAAFLFASAAIVAAEPNDAHRVSVRVYDMATGSATFATIYFQSIHRLSQAAGADEAQVLGYAIAHELGHLLLASHVHSDQGLMRPQWRERDLRRRRDSDWQFSAQDAAAIRDRLEAGRVSANIAWATRQRARLHGVYLGLE